MIYRLPLAYVIAGATALLTFLTGTSEPRVKSSQPAVAILQSGNTTPFRLTKIREYKSARTFTCSGGTVSYADDKHVMQLIFAAPGTTGSTSGSTTGVTTGTTGISTTGTTGLGTDASVESSPEDDADSMHTTGIPTTGVTTGATTGTTTGSTGSTTGGDTTTTAYYLFVPEGKELGQIPQSPSTQPTASTLTADGTHSATAGMWYLLQSGNEYPVQISATGPLSAANTSCALVTVVTHDWDEWVVDHWVHHHTVTYGVFWMDFTNYKKALGDAGVDSRKAYGQANRDGELPGDPNADPRPINFGDWIFKGGTFVGNMPFTSGDQSGTARIQLYATTGSYTDVRAAAVSMMDLGSPSSLSSSVAVGSFCPASSDANLSTTESTVTWDTRWSISPRGTAGNPPDPTQDPTEVQTLSGAATQDYLTWNLQTVTSSACTLPPNALTSVCLALNNESSYASSSLWRYFSSKENQALFSTFPLNDSAPRLWIADLTHSDSTWSWTTGS